MSRSWKIKLYIMLLALFSLTAFWVQGREHDASKTSIQQHSGKAAYRAPFKMSGMTYRNLHDGKLVSTVKADEVRVQDRKFWAFRVRPFKETVLENAKIQIYLERDGMAEVPDKKDQENISLIPFTKDMLSIGKRFNSHSMNKGVVSRAAIKHLNLEIYNADHPVMLIHAQKAYVDFRKRVLKMIDVSMKDVSSGKIIKSRSIKWNDDQKVFEIAGKYIAESREGISNGNMITIDLDFDIAPLRYGNS